MINFIVNNLLDSLNFTATYRLGKQACLTRAWRSKLVKDGHALLTLAVAAGGFVFPNRRGMKNLGGVVVACVSRVYLQQSVQHPAGKK